VAETNTLSLFREGVSAARAGDKARARLLLHEAAQAGPDNEMVWLWLAGVAERPQDTVAYLEKVLKLSPANERAHAGLKSARLQAGVAEARAGNAGAARAHLRAAAELDPGSEITWMWLASVAETAQESANACGRALALNPGNARARAGLVAALLKCADQAAADGDRARARQHLLDATGHDPACEAGWLLLAEHADTPEESIAHLERVLALNPNNTHARALFDAHQASLAPAWRCPLCQAEDDEPALGDPCPVCGCLLDLENPEALLRHEVRDLSAVRRVLKQLQAALPPEGDFAVHFWIGLARANLRHWPEAFAQFQAALALRTDRGLRAQVNRLMQLYASSAAARAAEQPPHRGTVLVVDDSPTVRKSVSLTLEAQGYRTRTAADGEEAVRSLREQGLPDLILLDITMPGMDGYQLCKLLKNTRGAQDVPVIMLSGKDGFFDKVRGRWVGATVYLTKPFKPEALLAEVGRHCHPRPNGPA
jgi:twitching motility two-component system response regulator PilG